MSLPRMSWHIGDYHKDTGHLRAAEHGAYFLLCLHYWATGGLPDDDRQLAAIARMTDREWRGARPIIEPFFKGDGKWKHKRIEIELADAQAKYEKRAGAGSKGGKAKANGKQSSSNATANAYQPITDNPKEDSEAKASDAKASDPRTQLFNKGLETLARITGKTPNSCRATVGMWLKSVNDEAIHVLGAIEEAERNRVVDPVAWINRVLQPKQGNRNGQANSNGLSRALAGLREHVGDIDRSEEGGVPPPRLLSHR